jgi:hypothetical protein
VKSKFFLFLALCCSAHADTIATLKNRAGGQIVLTDVETTQCKGFVGAAYSTGDNNQTTWGCWFSDDLMVHIRWYDGDTRAYPLVNFVVNEEVLRRYKDRKKGKSYDL